MLSRTGVSRPGGRSTTRRKRERDQPVEGTAPSIFEEDKEELVMMIQGVQRSCIDAETLQLVTLGTKSCSLMEDQ